METNPTETRSKATTSAPDAKGAPLWLEALDFAGDMVRGSIVRFILTLLGVAALIALLGGATIAWRQPDSSFARGLMWLVLGAVGVPLSLFTAFQFTAYRAVRELILESDVGPLVAGGLVEEVVKRVGSDHPALKAVTKALKQTGKVIAKAKTGAEAMGLLGDESGESTESAAAAASTIKPDDAHDSGLGGKARRLVVRRVRGAAIALVRRVVGKRAKALSVDGKVDIKKLRTAVGDGLDGLLIGHVRRLTWGWSRIVAVLVGVLMLLGILVIDWLPV